MKPIKLEIDGLNSFETKQVLDFEKLGEGVFGIFGKTEEQVAFCAYSVLLGWSKCTKLLIIFGYSIVTVYKLFLKNNNWFDYWIYCGIIISKLNALTICTTLIKDFKFR